MNMPKNKSFYRFIYKRGGMYQLQYKNEHYGFYERVEDALFDRDRLEQVDWDFELFCELPEIPNPYYHMELPDYEHDSTYITFIPAKYRVMKKINGKTRVFGDYSSLEDARVRRDECLSNNWEC